MAGAPRSVGHFSLFWGSFLLQPGLPRLLQRRNRYPLSRVLRGRRVRWATEESTDAAGLAPAFWRVLARNSVSWPPKRRPVRVLLSKSKPPTTPLSLLATGRRLFRPSVQTLVDFVGVRSSTFKIGLGGARCPLGTMPHRERPSLGHPPQRSLLSVGLGQTRT
jgi:hypothetical protein